MLYTQQQHLSTWFAKIAIVLELYACASILPWCYHFLADRTIGRAFGTLCRLSVCRLSVTFCIVAAAPSALCMNDSSSIGTRHRLGQNVQWAAAAVATRRHRPITRKHDVIHKTGVHNILQICNATKGGPRDGHGLRKFGEVWTVVFETCTQMNIQTDRQYFAAELEAE